MTKHKVVWDLTDFYKHPKDPQIQKDLEEIREEVLGFNKKVKGKIAHSEIKSEKLQEYLIQLEEIEKKVFYLNIYSYLAYSTNTTNTDIVQLYSKINDFTTEVYDKLVFFNLELNEIPEEIFKELIKSEELEDYRNYLNQNRKRKPHQLSEGEEQIIQMKNLTGKNGFLNMYMELTSSFEFDFEIDGKKKKLTGSELFSFLYNKDPSLRERALKTLLTAYEGNEKVFTHIYNNCMKDWLLECKKRNFKTPIEKRNLANQIDDSVVVALEKATTESYKPLVERYYTIKKEILGLPALKISDIYAPVGEISKKYTFEEAINLIKQADKKFDPEFEEIVDQIVKAKHIDATPRKGKTGGAYCNYGKFNSLPFVFSNYTGDVQSVFTLAHELGHALHFYYILREQNMVNIDVSLPVAEIASVFNEMIAFDYLLNTDMDKEEKLALLCNNIESNFATSHRQNAFHRFEEDVYSLIKEKQPTTKDLTTIFAKKMKEMFGTSIEGIEEMYSHFIFVISHFLHTPFYVYAYNMSNLLVIALYQLYLEKGQKWFVPKYKELLAVGSSLTPQEMLDPFGIDLADPSFWKKGLKYLGKQIEIIEKLIK